MLLNNIFHARLHLLRVMLVVMNVMLLILEPLKPKSLLLLLLFPINQLDNAFACPDILKQLLQLPPVLPAQQMLQLAQPIRMVLSKLILVLPDFSWPETDVMHKPMQLQASSGIPFQLPVNSKHATLLAKLAAETQPLIV
jgi:hypothetical protein